MSTERIENPDHSGTSGVAKQLTDIITLRANVVAGLSWLIPLLYGAGSAFRWWLYLVNMTLYLRAVYVISREDMESEDSLEHPRSTTWRWIAWGSSIAIFIINELSSNTSVGVGNAFFISYMCVLLAFAARSVALRAVPARSYEELYAFHQVITKFKIVIASSLSVQLKSVSEGTERGVEIVARHAGRITTVGLGICAAAWFFFPPVATWYEVLLNIVVFAGFLCAAFENARVRGRIVQLDVWGAKTSEFGHVDKKARTGFRALQIFLRIGLGVSIISLLLSDWSNAPEFGAVSWAWLLEGPAMAAVIGSKMMVAKVAAA